MVTPRTDGSFLVLWGIFDLSTGDNLGIHGQLLSAGGQLVGDQFQANYANRGTQYLPAALAFPDNKMVITWTDSGTAILGRYASVHVVVAVSITALLEIHIDAPQNHCVRTGLYVVGVDGVGRV